MPARVGLGPQLELDVILAGEILRYAQNDIIEGVSAGVTLSEAKGLFAHASRFEILLAPRKSRQTRCAAAPHSVCVSQGAGRREGLRL
jgi:hypothetical protein